MRRPYNVSRLRFRHSKPEKRVKPKPSNVSAMRATMISYHYKSRPRKSIARGVVTTKESVGRKKIQRRRLR